VTPPLPAAALCGPHSYLAVDVRRVAGSTIVLLICSRCAATRRVEVADT
jgi:hypothetical protein